MAIYKVSYVIIDKDNPGTILNQTYAAAKRGNCPARQ